MKSSWLTAFSCLLLLVPLAFGWSATTPAQDAEWVYYDAPLNRTILDPEARLDTDFPWVRGTRDVAALFTLALQRAELDRGDAWITGVMDGQDLSTRPPVSWRLVGRVPAGATPEGTLYLVQPGPDRWRPHGWHLQAVPFRWPAGATCTEAEYLDGRDEALARRERMDLPGREWFRAQRNTTRDLTMDPARRRQRLEGDFDRSFALFSGRRALQESLQVDRALALDEDVDADSTETTPIGQVEGITVPEVDWQALLDRAGATDVVIERLASWVPEDQVLVSLPNFATLVKLLDELDQRGTDLLQWFEERSEDAGSRAFLEQQLCLELSPLARELGKRLVRSVAVTTSDGYVREGTDLTLLLECDQPAAVLLQVEALRARARKMVPGCQDETFEHDGVSIHGVASPDRTISSYHAVVEDVLMVSNSPVAIQRLLDARAGHVPSHGASLEYRFFRHRYPWREQGEKALLTLSDAFLRRFCGPEWRVAESRRMRCAENLAALDCGARLYEGFSFVTRVIDAPCPSPDTTYRVEDGPWSCRLHGTRRFLTPLSETPVRKVTKAERRAYEQFRDRYQSYWTRVFDPVVLELDLAGDLAADLTVMPLIAGTDYREIREWTSGGELRPGMGDPHDALFHLRMRINRDSGEFRSAESAVQFFGLQGGGLGWVGDSVELFVDPDPVLDSLRDQEDPEEWIVQHLGELPLGVRITVRDPMKLGLFLVALRGVSDTVAPGMLLWETRKHGDIPYVVVHASPEAARQEDDIAELGIYYVAYGGALNITLSESMLHRVLDRAQARLAAGPEALVPGPVDGLGDHAQLTVQVDSALAAMNTLFGGWQDAGLGTCLANVPILTEWMVRHPDQDPVAVHEELFHAALTCPRGGTYRFDVPRRLVHCSEHGSVFEPRRSEGIPAGLEDVGRLLGGLTFEEDGVRVRFLLERRGS